MYGAKHRGHWNFGLNVRAFESLEQSEHNVCLLGQVIGKVFGLRSWHITHPITSSILKMSLDISSKIVSIPSRGDEIMRFLAV